MNGGSPAALARSSLQEFSLRSSARLRGVPETRAADLGLLTVRIPLFGSPVPETPESEPFLIGFNSEASAKYMTCQSPVCSIKGLSLRAHLRVEGLPENLL